jgi:signal peptidase I
MEHWFTETYPDPLPDELTGGLKHLLWDTIQTLLLSVVLYLIINAATARITVRSVSMQPTLFEKDFVLVNKLAYRFDTPQRGDVIVFDPPLPNETEPYIKRVIGLPGDVIEIKNRQVFVNGEQLTETYIMAEPNYIGTWTVPEDQLFVLGDNRNNSSDSHQWGMVPLKSVIGKAEFIYFPLAHWKILHVTPTAAAAEP